MKRKATRFDRLVARYYPAVYSFAARFTDDPRKAVALTRDAFRSSQKQLRNLRDQRAVATTLISAVLRAGIATTEVLFLRSPGTFRKGTETGLGCARPTRSRHVSLLETPGKRVPSRAGILSG